MYRYEIIDKGNYRYFESIYRRHYRYLEKKNSKNNELVSISK
jgi:hypothetical protein